MLKAVSIQVYNYLLQPEEDLRWLSQLFNKFLALIYLAAFFSLSSQIVGLVGSQGILPFADYLNQYQSHFGSRAFYRMPTLFWLGINDTILLWSCYLGAFLSLLVLFGRWVQFALIALFLLYLSLFYAGQIFLNFQWDYLLLEAGFLSIFLARGPNRLIIFLFHWLLFRLRFLSGYSKIASGDPAWSGLTTLNTYFESQPLPHIGAWYAHQLPEWLLSTATALVLFAELVVPFFIFLPRKFRIFAALFTIIIQLGIVATSNHNWINLLTIALCLFLLDDRFVRSLFPKLIKDEQSLPPGHRKTLVVAAFLLVTTSLATMTELMAGYQTPAVLERIRAFGIGNSYHVFPTMQIERHELMIEGSDDGVNWLRYRFKYKPDDVSDTPKFTVPHQPRLDWMIWFIPPQAEFMRHWFDSFIWRLKENTVSVT